MADPDRRPYGAGGEPPLTLGERRAPRSRRPAPVTLIVSVLILVVALGAVAWLYRGGARGPDSAPQPVGAPLGDVRVAAPPQSQTPDAAAGLSIYKDKADTGATPAFAPPPEEPAPAPAHGDASGAPAGSGAAPAAPDIPQTPPPPAPHAAAAAPRGDALGALIDRSTRPAPARTEKLAQAGAPRPAPAAGAADVQIGAFSSEAQADEAWGAAAAAAPGAMAGHGKRVAPLTRDGVTLFRTYITGFASRDAAQALCDRLKSAGRSCFVR
jgi:hypothetical protein